MVKNKKFQKGETFVVQRMRQGSSSYGDYCFMLVDQNESNSETKCSKELTIISTNGVVIQEGEIMRVLEIDSVARKTSKKGDKYYENVYIEAKIEKVDRDFERRQKAEELLPDRPAIDKLELIDPDVDLPF